MIRENGIQVVRWACALSFLDSGSESNNLLRGQLAKLIHRFGTCFRPMSQERLHSLYARLSLKNKQHGLCLFFISFKMI